MASQGSPSSFATQQLGLREACAGRTTRLLHSHAYIVAYMGIAVVNLVTLIWSFITFCPGPAFLALELGVSLLLFADFVIRLIVAGTDLRNFFASFSNVLDLIGFVTCILSIYILSLGCTEAEKVSDMLLMFVRIGIQGTRLVLILRKNRESMARVNSRVDFSAVSDHDDDDDDHALQLDDLLPTGTHAEPAVSAYLPRHQSPRTGTPLIM